MTYFFICCTDAEVIFVALIEIRGSMRVLCVAGIDYVFRCLELVVFMDRVFDGEVGLFIRFIVIFSFFKQGFYSL